jgi:hypothetical protein
MHRSERGQAILIMTAVLSVVLIAAIGLGIDAGGTAPARPAAARKAPPSAVRTAPAPAPEPKPAVTSAPKPPVHTVQVINGNKRSNETFPETGAQQ